MAAGALAVIGVRPLDAETSPLPVGFVEPLTATAMSVTYALPATDGVMIDRRHEVMLTRWQQSIYAFALACPHQKTALRWIEKDTRFQCPKHKSKYQPDGTFISGKATRGMDRHALRREGETIVVDTAVLHRQDANPSGWSASTVRLTDG